MVLPEIDYEVGSCVYKLYCGDKYVIVKAKTLSGSIFLIEKGYSYFAFGGGGSGNDVTGEGHKEWEGKNSYYYRFYKWVKANEATPLEVKIITESKSGYQLLKSEQILLDAAVRDSNCLNNNVVSYIPKFRESTKSYGWITKRNVTDFKRFLGKL